MLADKLLMRPSTLTGIGEFLLWYRSKRDLSLQDLALQLGVSKAYIHQVESGKFLLPQAFIESIKTCLTNEEKEIMVDAVMRAVKDTIN